MKQHNKEKRLQARRAAYSRTVAERKDIKGFKRPGSYKK